MKDKPRNKKSIFVVLILLICCAAYLAYDVAAGATPVLSFLFPTGAVLLFCIYMLLKSLCFENTGEKIITSLDELDVVPISEAAADGSYPLGRSVLTDNAYARWQSIIKHALKHKTLISKGVFR